jgi:3-hydroxyacyl-CoA dehydrogenase/enoyl-CoA hydratase/3-hydroxybutyryl-CoA epimerase
MPIPIPTMHQFRTAATGDGILHLIFDAPGRSMNVFSNAAIKELEAFATARERRARRGRMLRKGIGILRRRRFERIGRGL